MNVAHLFDHGHANLLLPDEPGRETQIRDVDAEIRVGQCHFQVISPEHGQMITMPKMRDITPGMLLSLLADSM